MSERAMSMHPHVHQCPYCELRFTYLNEVKDHIVHDHPEHAAGFVSLELHELPEE